MIWIEIEQIFRVQCGRLTKGVFEAFEFGKADVRFRLKRPAKELLITQIGMLVKSIPGTVLGWNRGLQFGAPITNSFLTVAAAAAAAACGVEQNQWPLLTCARSSEMSICGADCFLFL